MTLRICWTTLLVMAFSFRLGSTSIDSVNEATRTARPGLGYQPWTPFNSLLIPTPGLSHFH